MNEELEGLNLVELLDLLEPVPEPPPISMWPQTAGWIWLGLVLLLALAFIARLIVRNWRANAYRREALAEIGRCENDTAALAAIVRRTALAAYPRADVAGRFGDDWLVFLDETFDGNGFRQGAGRALIEAPYAGAASEIPSRDCAALATHWVKRHKRDRAKRS